MVDWRPKQREEDDGAGLETGAAGFFYSSLLSRSSRGLLTCAPSSWPWPLPELPARRRGMWGSR